MIKNHQITLLSLPLFGLVLDVVHSNIFAYSTVESTKQEKREK